MSEPLIEDAAVVVEAWWRRMASQRQDTHAPNIASMLIRREDVDDVIRKIRALASDEHTAHGRGVEATSVPDPIPQEDFDAALAQARKERDALEAASHSLPGHFRSAPAAADEVLVGGVYRHRKGGEYVVEAVALESTNGRPRERVVVYRGDCGLNVRTEREFLEVVDGAPRFALVFISTTLQPAPAAGDGK